jgi:hypothetical protein
MHEQYYKFIAVLNAARQTGDTKKIKTYETKLKNWRLKYGAHQPITNNNYNSFE